MTMEVSVDVSIEASMETAIKDDLRLEITDIPRRQGRIGNGA